MKRLVKIICLVVAVTLVSAIQAKAQVSVGVSIQAGIAPPPLPVYVQPACPVDGYIWEPGYWAWDPEDEDYYWVPGVWVAPPSYGLLWTPCYWGFDDGVYVFHAGYWGPTVGFYGGINYGYGYYGRGFCGGGWYGDHFRYNTAVWNVNRTVVHNTYVNRSVVRQNTIVNNRVAYNGGRGGVMARPTMAQRSAMNQRHIQPTSVQRQHQMAALKDRSQFAKVNHGRPGLTAMRKVDPQQFRQRANTASNRAGRQQNVRQQSFRNNAARQAGAVHSHQQYMNPRGGQRQSMQQPRYQAQRSQQGMQRQHYQAQRFQQPRMQQQHYQAQRFQQPRMQQHYQAQRYQQPRMQPQREFRAQRMEAPQHFQQPRMQPQRMIQPQQRGPQPQRDRHNR